VIKWLLIAVVAVVALLWWRMSAMANGNLPKAGAAAPEFNLPDQDGKLRASGEFRGKWLVLYFYPRDDTPGCTEQAARFRDALRDIEALGATVCGVSVDDSESHAEFARRYNLPFTLLADRKGETAGRYGSLLNLGVVRFAKRNSFLVDPQGRVAKVYLGANPARNAAEVTADLRRLAAS
jgi:peroxiredoxin Q/BCP